MRRKLTSQGYPQFPRTLGEFQRRFSTEKACLGYLALVRWPEGFGCPWCGSRIGWRVGLRRWRCRGCRRNVQLTAGTILQDSHLPIRYWFWAAYLMSTLTPGISALQLKHQLGIGSYRTALSLCRRLRRAMVNPMREPLKGVVEVDDAYIGGPEHRRGRRRIVGRRVETKIPIGVVVENRGDHAGRVRMEVLPDLTHDALAGFIGRSVAADSQVNTDALPAYRGLDPLKYHHCPKVQREPKRAGKILPWVHQVIGNLKTWLRGTHHGRITRQHLQSYLDEFTFRFNRRNYREHAFLSLLVLATRLKPMRAPLKILVPSSA